MSTGFPRLASAGSNSASFDAVSGESSDSSRPAASQASEQRIPRPPGVRQDRDAAPAGQRLGGEQCRCVDQLLERGCPQHSGLVEQGLDGLLRAGERGRVRPRSPGAGAGRPALHCEDRLLAGDAARDPAESPGIAERLEVEQRRAGLGSSSQYSRRSLAETSALLPTEMKDEKPRLRSDAFSRRARPSAPLWDEKPIEPGR